MTEKERKEIDEQFMQEWNIDESMFRSNPDAFRDSLAYNRIELHFRMKAVGQPIVEAIKRGCRLW